MVQVALFLAIGLAKVWRSCCGTPCQDELQGSYRAPNKSIWSKKCQGSCWRRPFLRSSSKNVRKYQKTHFFPEQKSRKFFCWCQFFFFDWESFETRFGKVLMEKLRENCAKTRENFAKICESLVLTIICLRCSGVPDALSKCGNNIT